MRYHWLFVIMCTVLTTTLCRAAQPEGRATGSQDLQIRVEALAAPPGELLQALQSFPHTLEVRARRERPDDEAPPPQRDPQLSEQHWFIQAIDRDGEVRYQTVIQDPRVLRAELPDKDGTLHGETFYHAEANFLVTLPRDPRLVELRVYQPRWTGETHVLDHFGTVNLR